MKFGAIETLNHLERCFICIKTSLVIALLFRAEQLFDGLDGFRMVVIAAFFVPVPTIIPREIVKKMRIAEHELLSTVLGSDLAR